MPLVIGLIPHAGKEFAGDLRKQVFQTLKEDQYRNLKAIDTFICYLAPVHQWVDPPSLYLDIPRHSFVKKPSWAYIASKHPTVTNEHSFRWVRPELEEAFPNLPILVCYCAFPSSHTKLMKQTRTWLLDLISQHNVILIGTSDLIHYGPEYRVTNLPFPPQLSKMRREAPLIEALKYADVSPSSLGAGIGVESKF